MIEGRIAGYSEKFYGVNEMGFIYYEKEGKRVYIDMKRNITPKESRASERYLRRFFSTLASLISSSIEPRKPLSWYEKLRSKKAQEA